MSKVTRYDSLLAMAESGKVMYVKYEDYEHLRAENVDLSCALDVNTKTIDNLISELRAEQDLAAARGDMIEKQAKQLRELRDLLDEITKHPVVTWDDLTSS